MIRHVFIYIKRMETAELRNAGIRTSELVVKSRLRWLIGYDEDRDC